MLDNLNSKDVTVRVIHSSRHFIHQPTNQRMMCFQVTKEPPIQITPSKSKTKVSTPQKPPTSSNKDPFETNFSRTLFKKNANLNKWYANNRLSHIKLDNTFHFKKIQGKKMHQCRASRHFESALMRTVNPNLDASTKDWRGLIQMHHAAVSSPKTNTIRWCFVQKETKIREKEKIHLNTKGTSLFMAKHCTCFTTLFAWHPVLQVLPGRHVKMSTVDHCETLQE